MQRTPLKFDNCLTREMKITDGSYTTLARSIGGVLEASRQALRARATSCASLIKRNKPRSVIAKNSLHRSMTST